MKSKLFSVEAETIASILGELQNNVAFCKRPSASDRDRRVGKVYAAILDELTTSTIIDEILNDAQQDEEPKS